MMGVWKDRTKAHSYNKEWRKENTAWILEANKRRVFLTREWFKAYKATLRCEECGENHPATLDFHHIDPSAKTGTPGRQSVRQGWCKERILKELQKCRVLCANCHRKLHWKEKNVE